MKTIDWSGIYKKYRGKWVALEDDEITVISSGKTLDQTSEDAEKKGFKNPIFMKIPERSTYFVGKINIK